MDALSGVVATLSGDLVSLSGTVSYLVGLAHDPVTLGVQSNGLSLS